MNYKDGPEKWLLERVPVHVCEGWYSRRSGYQVAFFKAPWGDFPKWYLLAFSWQDDKWAFHKPISISYCPYCGKRLPPEREDGERLSDGPFRGAKWAFDLGIEIRALWPFDEEA